MTVILNGVSLTKVRLHDWHAEVDTALTVVPAVMVTAVGAVADAMGMVQVPLSGCDLVLQHPPLHGTYEMIPCTRIYSLRYSSISFRNSAIVRQTTTLLP